MHNELKPFINTTSRFKELNNHYVFLKSFYYVENKKTLKENMVVVKFSSLEYTYWINYKK